VSIDKSAVGLVGLGTMGSAIANVLSPHHRLVVWDADQAAVDRQRAAGVQPATDPGNLADGADVVLLSLPGPDEVRSVISGVDGVLTAERRPLVVVDLSTVGPDTTRDLATAAADRGVGYLDAPVLGRPHRCGAWTLPVGGPKKDLDLARPVLDALASHIVRVGDHGAGNVVKLLNNLIFGAINAITAETMAAAAQLGLNPQLFYTTLADSGAATVSNLFHEIAPKIVASDWSPTFTVDLLTKDNRLALAMIEQAGFEPRLAKAITSINEAGQAAGLGALDTSAITQLFQVQ
jgi:3-hydroxyisobutyrate dehydrogenase-like beta-hydroxyacid dehydrogenase